MITLFIPSGDNTTLPLSPRSQRISTIPLIPYLFYSGGAQALLLSTGCFTRKIILHELMHALGFIHEHSNLPLFHRVGKNVQIARIEINMSLSNGPISRREKNTTLTRDGPAL